MNLLPKTSEEFATKDYWNQFFKKRGKSSFDWYGEFPELCGIISKYVKTKDTILNVGCGNSKLSIDMYKTGYKSITNIDLSEVVINQMNKTYCDNGEFLQMDATQMSFENEKFSVIIDKGTLDAMMSEETEESKIATKYFSEVKRVLKSGGRFVIISLLQTHIINALLSFFPANNFLLRVIRCYEAEEKTASTNEDNSSMPVFVIVATKFLKLPNKILEILNDGETIERLPDDETLTKNILTTQRASMIRNGLIRKSSYEDEINFDLFRPNEKIPRYSLYILDQKSTSKLSDYAAFIVNQGRETEWLFATKQGRRKLLESAQHARLAIVVMHRNQVYTTLDDIKLELNETIKSFAPKSVKNMSKIPFLSLGSDVGTRNVIYKGKSDLSGDFVIEDVIGTDDRNFRRLVFLNNQFVIQSEALLKKVKKKVQVDHSYLSCQHHTYMILGMLIAQSSISVKNNWIIDSPSSGASRNLIIGLGGGGLLMYIYNYLKGLPVTVVEIDPEIVKIAKDFFGLVHDDDDRLNVVVDDGLNYLTSPSSDEFQSILFDVDSKDQSAAISCPPISFLSNKTLQDVNRKLTPDGSFILNFVCRDEQSRSEVLKKISEVFPFIISYKLKEDVNEIFYCFKNKINDFNKKLYTAGDILLKFNRSALCMKKFEENMEVYG